MVCYPLRVTQQDFSPGLGGMLAFSYTPFHHRRQFKRGLHLRTLFMELKGETCGSPEQWEMDTETQAPSHGGLICVS